MTQNPISRRSFSLGFTPKIMCTMALLATGASAETIHTDVWADNWFAMYVGESLVKEDSVSITTERSFNAESFNFDVELPTVINFVIKDFKENDTGLEYIGSNRQQMGDGGFIAQFSDVTTGEALLVSNNQWRCLPIHIAPLDKSCEKSTDPETDCGSSISSEPANWQAASFDDSQWPFATEHSFQSVQPKDGYNKVDWNSEAKFIWTSDLESDNTLLCRVTLSVNEE